jgi:hypothetical protein
MTFRPGEKVAPYDNMGITGTVVAVTLQGSQQMMVGGTMQGLWIVTVKLDKTGETVTFRSDRLRKLE